MKLPKINRDQCQTANASQCAAGGGGSGDGGGGNQRLILEPGFAILCEENTVQFQTLLAGDAGQVLLTQGLLYTTSDSSILAIDSASGSATKTGEGIVTISVQWRDLIASAQITCSGDGNCCADVTVEMVVLRDRSRSMQQPGAGGTKDSAGFIIIKHAFAPVYGGILTGPGAKDSASRIDFSETAVVASTLTPSYGSADGPAPRYSDLGPGVAFGNTNIPAAFDLALEQFNSGTQRVIIIVSDGQNWPELATDERQALMNKAESFKEDGGLIICVGIAADSHGFPILQDISSGGFFVNVHWSDIGAGAVDAIALVKGMLCMACAGNRSSGSGYGCTDDSMPSAQFPDNTFGDVERGEDGGGGGGDLPRLPSPIFDPVTESQIGNGMDVAIAVLGHAGVNIRYTITTDGSVPADPNFSGVGTDYNGRIHIDQLANGAVAKIKAIAHDPLQLYNDSLTANAIYPQGSSTNGLPIVWANGDMQPANPYPSVTVVSGVAGLITSVKVKLKNLHAQELVPKAVILVGPDGTAVVLMGADGSTNTYSNVIAPGATLTFDDAAANSLPYYGPPALVDTASYKPTVRNNVQNTSLPAPAPASPYQTTLAAFIGKNPNGSWKLYAIHINFYTAFGTNQADGGWELQLTSA